MRIYRAKGSLPVIGMLLVLVVLALTGGGIAGAASLPATPSPSPTTEPPRKPPANIPVYPDAKLQGVENATVHAKQATTWAYTVSGPNVTISSVARFYEQNMPKNGWTQKQAVPPENVQGVYGATVLVYQEQAQPGTPTPSDSEKQMAIIAAGTNNQTNPHEIGFVITLVK